MDELTYNRISAHWKGDVYQTYPSVQVDSTTKHVSLLVDRRVVDIGANAGLLTYIIAEKAEAVCGVEPNLHYYKQALQTARLIAKPCYFVYSTLADFLRSPGFDFDAAFAAHTLYFLSKKEVCLIREVLLPKCKIVLFVSREDKPTVKSKRGIRNGLYSYKAIGRLLRSAGMAVEYLDVGTNWVSVVGRAQ